MPIPFIQPLSLSASSSSGSPLRPVSSAESFYSPAPVHCTATPAFDSPPPYSLSPQSALSLCPLRSLPLYAVSQVRPVADRQIEMRHLASHAGSLTTCGPLTLPASANTSPLRAPPAGLDATSLSPLASATQAKTGAAAQAPEPPRLRIDVDKLLVLVSPHISEHRLLLWGDERLNLDGTLRDSFPPWSLSLESWFRMSHPYSWVVLGEDYKKMVLYFQKMVKWVETRESEGADRVELEELEQLRDDAQDGARQIFLGFYGVYWLRSRFLAQYRLLGVTWDDSKIINTAVTFERSSSSSGPVVYGFSDESVWPLPLPISAIPVPPKRPLVILSQLNHVEIRPYRLSELSERYAIKFRPMSLATLLETAQLSRAKVHNREETRSPGTKAEGVGDLLKDKAEQQQGSTYERAGEGCGDFITFE